MNKYEHLTKYIHLFKRHKSGQSQNYMYIFIWNTRTLLLHRPASCSVPTCRMYNRPCKKKTHANIYCLYALLKTVSFWNLTKTQNHPSKYDMQIIGTPTNILELETLGYCYDLENGLNKPVMWVTSITHLARSRTQRNWLPFQLYFATSLQRRPLFRWGFGATSVSCQQCWAVCTYLTK